MNESALEILDQFHSWQLQRVSAKTVPQDVVVRVNRSGQALSASEIDGIKNWIRRGVCYRCRIAKGRYFFGDTALAAAKQAAKAAKEADREPKNVPINDL